MKNTYTNLGVLMHIQESIKKRNANAKLSRLLLFSMVMTSTILFVSTSTNLTHQTCEDTPVSLDTDCMEINATSIPQLHLSETKKTTTQTYKVAQMGFSFYDIWNYLISRFSNSNKEKKEDIPHKIIKSNTQYAVNADSTLCDCEEYIYLNDTQLEGVHKFLVVGDTVSEVLAANGGPWLQNVIDPHGVGMDLNGYLYIGDRTTDPRQLMRITCSGVILDNDVTGDTEFSALNLEVIGNTLYSYDATGIKAWNTCDGALLEAYDPETGPCNVTNADRDDGWGFVLGGDGNFYGSRYIDITLNGTPVLILDVYQYSTDYTTWGPDCSIPVYFSDTLYDAGLERLWGISQHPATGNFVTVATQHSVSGRPSIIYMYDSTGVLVDTLRDDTNDLTGFAGTRGVTYSPALDKFLLATQNGDCISAIRIDDTTGELEFCDPLIPFVNDSQGKGLVVVQECCPKQDVTIDTTYCGAIGDEILISEFFLCEGTVCEGGWEAALTNDDTAIPLQACNNSVEVLANGCGTFTNSFDATTVLNPTCPSYTITINVCFEVFPPVPEISVTNNVCPSTTGTFNIVAPCDANSTLEYSTDNGLTWSTTAPAYDVESTQTVTVRCINNNTGCETSAVPIVTSPDASCVPTCPDPNCFGITIQQN